MESKSKTVFGAKLARVRKGQRISQGKLAELVDLDHSYISRLEAGARMPARDTVIRIATALNIPKEDNQFDIFLDSAGFCTPGIYRRYESKELYRLSILYDDADMDTKAEIDTAVRFIVEAMKERSREDPRGD